MEVLKRKSCNKCMKRKAIKHFYVDRQKGDSLLGTCKKCINPKKNSRSKKRRKKSPESIRNAALKHEFGIDLKYYNFLFKKQKGRCAICRNHRKIFNRDLDVDHCHKTGKVRGLLCGLCNKAIGLFKENVKVISKSIQYIENGGQ